MHGHLNYKFTRIFCLEFRYTSNVNMNVKKHRIIIFPVFFVRVGKLTVIENIVLRKRFGPKREEVTEEWRRLHNEEHYDLYSRPIIIGVIKSRRIWLSRHVACISFTIVAQWVLVEKAEEKRSLGRPRRRWENNIKLDLKEVWWMA